MTIYNTVFIFLLIASLIEAILWYRNSVHFASFSEAKLRYNIKSYKGVHLLLLIEMAALCFISAVRATTVGTDMLTYIPRYATIAQSTWSELKGLAELWNFEIGFVFFCKLISLIDPSNLQIFTIVTSIITTFGFYLFIKEYSFLPQMSLFIFVTYGYWTNSFNTVRQYLAISILLMALILWRKDKAKTKIFAAILTVFAVSIHLSSLCFVVIYFIKNRHVSDKTYLVVLLIALIMFITPISLIDWLLSFTPYGKYVNRQGSGGTMLLVLFCIFLFVYMLRLRIEKADKNSRLWFWMFSIAIIMNVLALKIGLFERLMRLFLVSLLVIVPNSICVLKKNSCSLCLYFVVILLFSLYFYIILMSSQESSSYTIPYLPFWR